VHRSREGQKVRVNESEEDSILSVEPGRGLVPPLGDQVPRV